MTSPVHLMPILATALRSDEIGPEFWHLATVLLVLTGLLTLTSLIALLVSRKSVLLGLVTALGAIFTCQYPLLFAVYVRRLDHTGPISEIAIPLTLTLVAAVLAAAWQGLKMKTERK